MRKLLFCAGLATVCACWPAQSSAFERTVMSKVADRKAQMYPWHGEYYYLQWGAPVALVVPPTAELHTEYGWGVTNRRILATWHQYKRPYPGGASPGGFYGLPKWPSDTSQFGVYYVRGPW
ncbi:MAG: hypothetical protein K1X74_05675 [Pirellulales bacterium]|nr:hypothetical protein [Pirellulales bacterium]